jgi:PAS domain S-box-containing protein
MKQSLALRIYVSALAIGAAACAAMTVAGPGWTLGRPIWEMASFAALLGVAEYLIVRLRLRNETAGINLFEAVLAPLIFAASGIGVLAAVAAGQAAAGAARRNRPIKVTFNIAQWVIATAIGDAVYGKLGTRGVLTAHNAAGLAIAMLAIAAVNQVLLLVVLNLAEGRPVRALLAEISPILGLSFLINTAFAGLFVAAYGRTPLAVTFFIVPILVLFLANRAYAAAAAEHNRVKGLHRASRALSGPVDPREAIPAFLAEVRESFQGAAADLVLVEQDGRTVYRATADGSSAGQRKESFDEETIASLLLRLGQTTRLDARGSKGPLGTVLEREGWKNCIASPIVDQDRVLGVLCVYDRGGMEGFEQGGATVLEALANEAARALVKSALLETILEERQKLSEIVESTSDGILSAGPGGTIRTWNPAFERITGFASEEMVGLRYFSRLLPRDTDGRAVWLENWIDDVPLPTDLQITTSTGESRWLSCSYTRVCDADGKPSTLIVVARDATEAREVERLKDDFVATVSHELRTPLTPIKGWAATMLQLGDRLDERQRDEGVKAILRHAERLEQLITNILEVTRIERGVLERHDTVVDVAGVVEKVVADFRTSYPKREIHLDVEGTELRTRGDELWTEQIVTNLVSNALKYAPPAEPVEVCVGRTNGDITVMVTDRGPGISAHDMELIFERFKRLGDHMTRTTSGSGLGLYIARQLAHAVGGRLGVRSAPGGGATFELSLPAADRAQKAEKIPVRSAS